jgi:hypothetical protein
VSGIPGHNAAKAILNRAANSEGISAMH